MVMGRLMFGSPPINDAGTVPAAVPTKVPSRDLLLQGPLPADLRRGLFFSNSTASSTECVSICSFLSNTCSWEMFTFHLICERCQSPFTYRTPSRSQTHRRLKTNMGSRAERRAEDRPVGIACLLTAPLQDLALVPPSTCREPSPTPPRRGHV